MQHLSVVFACHVTSDKGAAVSNVHSPNEVGMQVTDVAETLLQASHANPVLWLPSARLDCSKCKPVVIRQTIQRLTKQL